MLQVWCIQWIEIDVALLHVVIELGMTGAWFITQLLCWIVLADVALFRALEWKLCLNCCNFCLGLQVECGNGLLSWPAMNCCSLMQALECVLWNCLLQLVVGAMFDVMTAWIVIDIVAL